MKWIIPKRREDSANVFNVPLPENAGGISVLRDVAKRANFGDFEADHDIREGRVKKFESVEKMIDELEKPW